MIVFAGSVRQTTNLDQTAVGRCVVDEDTRLVRSTCNTGVSASITGAVTSSVRPARRSSRSTDVADHCCTSSA